MAYPKLLGLSDHELALEVTNATRNLHAIRRRFHAEGHGIEDAAWDLLYRGLLDAEKYLRFCLAEKSRRETAATFRPKKPRRQRTLVQKDKMPLPPPSPEPRAADARHYPEPAGDPVIVFEPNGPRRWRKGDPIY